MTFTPPTSDYDTDDTHPESDFGSNLAVALPSSHLRTTKSMAPAQGTVTEDQPSNTDAEKHSSDGKTCDTQKETANDSPTSPSHIPPPPQKSPLRLAQNLKEGPQSESPPEKISNKESPLPHCTLPRDKEDSAGSRIPRGTGLKQSANISAQKGTRCTPELRSSIPVSVQRRSVEQLRVNLQGKQSESSSGIRMVEKPRGPRPRPVAEQASLVTSESAQGVDQAQISTPTSISSSSASSWDFGDEGDVPERPTNVFTGEYRTRILNVPGNQATGPTLRIATSADNIILGGTLRDPPNYAVTQRTNPSKVRYFDKLLPSTPKVFSSSPKGNTPASDTKKSVGGSSKKQSTQVARDLRGATDISGKEMSISRKPVSKPSLSNLFSPSSKSPRIGEEHLVPKIPDEYCTDMTKNNLQPATPAKIASEPEATPASAETKITQTPVTAIKTGTSQSHPPRTSSLRALSEFPNNPAQGQCHASAAEAPPKAATNLRRNVTFNDFVSLTFEKEKIPAEGIKTRIPESRSTHLLGSFRNIFKSRIGVSDKEGTKREGEDSEFTDENTALQSGRLRLDSEKRAKPKPKYTRLSSGVSWNKSVRNPKSPTSSPNTPTSSVPRLLAPPNRHPDSSVPSFARPTKSTRTKAASGLGGPASTTTPEVRPPRRPHIRTASTGSPQRVTSGPRRAATNLLAFAGQKRNVQSPFSEPENAVSVADESTDSLPKNVDAVRSCLDTLCRKVGEATTPLDRERHIRLALNLQQQLADYQHIERGALEAEDAAKEKRSERKAAEECLNTSLVEVQAQLEET
ncbi:hypothetical protein ASPCAL09129 [Aspergillus calidoustus]|uniref:Uncharacterized protein n=1 Tax=Aspergillus calidoustus TaxID=454130 RepID=A0A0U5GTI2_ASPCI|nr:hypothetical protein ASPCAL09129 [Aspergillus calidoustus]